VSKQLGVSWGRWPRYQQQIIPVVDRFAALAQASPMLAFGNGRSYGDVCLNDGGTLLATHALNRFIEFDIGTGMLECEAGLLLSDIIKVTLPHGWFPPVTPGTALVSVGGAIANDVHGKNHHRAGSFGHHLHSFELRRSSGELLRCSPESNADWFYATIGGLGLTGLITTARLQLRRVPGAWFEGGSRRFSNLEQFFALAAEADARHEYTVAWLDCAATGGKLGRGIFMYGDHSARVGRTPSERLLRFPITPPLSPIGPRTVRIFNALYFHRPAAQSAHALWHYRPFLYPLDGILEWNRMYGPKGFFQYQCVLPAEEAAASLREMLQLIATSGEGSFLAVLKRFGDRRSLGWLSFPRPGFTLALDFPNRGTPTLRLLDALDDITRAAKGAVYPAKDARMSPAAFREYFPLWTRLQPYVDPKFSSSFWRRVMEAH
jgi:FAD/FMN-containing dehydrogenase